MHNDSNPMNLNPTGRGGFQDHPELINKKGRPPKGFTWPDILEEIGETTPEPEKNGKTFKQLVGMRLWVEAAGGNLNAIKVLLNRMEGYPRTKMDVGGEIDSSSQEVAKLMLKIYAELHKNGTSSKDNS